MSIANVLRGLVSFTSRDYTYHLWYRRWPISMNSCSNRKQVSRSIPKRKIHSFRRTISGLYQSFELVEIDVDSREARQPCKSSYIDQKRNIMMIERRRCRHCDVNEKDLFVFLFESLHLISVHGCESVMVRMKNASTLKIECKSHKGCVFAWFGVFVGMFTHHIRLRV